MKNDLRPYQRTGAAWLASQRACLLADVPGLGKTAQALVALVLRWPDGAPATSPAVIVAPASVVPVWQAEAEAWLPPAPYPRPLILSYEQATRHPEQIPDRISVLICDESHYLKTPDAGRTQRVLCGPIALGRRAGAVWLLSGTPMPNHPGELWTMLRCFSRTRLSYAAFIKEFCETRPSPYGTETVIIGAKKGKVGELRAMLSPIMLRRKKEQVLKDLPPITFSTRPIPALLAQYSRGRLRPDIDPVLAYARAYPEHREGTVAYKIQSSEEQDIPAQWEELEKLIATAKKSGVDVLDALNSCADHLATLRRWIGMAKVAGTVTAAIDMLEGGQNKLVIFGAHRAVVNGIAAGLAEYLPSTIHGGTPTPLRAEAVRRFQEDKSCRVFVGQIQAAGTGITLHAADRVLMAEMDWTPSNNLQAAMRIHRIGQKRACLVEYLYLPGSLDEYITKAVERKSRQIEQIIETT